MPEHIVRPLRARHVATNCVGVVCHIGLTEGGEVRRLLPPVASAPENGRGDLLTADPIGVWLYRTPIHNMYEIPNTMLEGKWKAFDPGFATH